MAPRPDAPADAAPIATGGIDEAALYVIIRKAVEDAILGAIGTVVLLGLAFVLGWLGITVTVSAFETSLVRAGGGAVLVVFGCYLAASELGYLPSVSDLV